MLQLDQGSYVGRIDIHVRRILMWEALLYLYSETCL